MKTAFPSRGQKKKKERKKETSLSKQKNKGKQRALSRSAEILDKNMLTNFVSRLGRWFN